MPKTYASIWLHAVWSTKNRVPVLKKSFRYKLFMHIKEHAKQENIHIDIINGVEDHVHCLFRLKTTESPSNMMQRIKGESSHWINTNVVLEERFSWQEGYGIFSVSEKNIKQVRAYIYNQEQHHKTMSYKEELKRLL